MNIAAHLGDDILNAWIDGVATPDEQSVVERHVRACETCQQRLSELRAVKAMLTTLPPATPRRSFTLTPEQAGMEAPTPIRREDDAPGILRLLPVVRALSVAAILAVIILGGTLALNTPSGPGETDGSSTAFMQQESPRQPAPGEVVDQGEAASAHDSTSDALANEAQGGSATNGETTDSLSPLQVSTMVAAAAAVVLTVIWIGMSLSRRTGHRA